MLNYKKLTFWVIMVSIAAVVAIGVGLTANPKSNPLLTPKSSEVTDISIEQINEGVSLGVVGTTDKIQIEAILKALQNTNKTMQKSVNDSPKRDDYLQININGSSFRRFYLYSDSETYFIEEPYIGIYKTSRETSVSIEKIYIGNFGSGVGAKYAAYDDGETVLLKNKWFYFEKESDNESAAEYSITKHDKNGDMLAEGSPESQILAQAILMDVLVKSSARKGMDISTLDEYYLIRQAYPKVGEVHDYYVYRLEDGTAALQSGVNGMYSVLSHDLYESLAKYVVLYPGTTLDAKPGNNTNYRQRQKRS